MIELLIFIFFIIIIIYFYYNYKKSQINNEKIELNEYEQKFEDIINYIYNNLNTIITKIKNELFIKKNN